MVQNSEGKDTDLKVENFVVVHDHVNRPTELLPVGFRVNLLNGDLMCFAPLYTDSRIKVVQLASAQGDGLVLMLVRFLDLKLFQLLQQLLNCFLLLVVFCPVAHF